MCAFISPGTTSPASVTISNLRYCNFLVGAGSRCLRRGAAGHTQGDAAAIRMQGR
jgi:hypothetical protein